MRQRKNGMLSSMHSSLVAALACILAPIVLVSGPDLAATQTGPGDDGRVLTTPQLRSNPSAENWPCWRGPNSVGIRAEPLNVMQWSPSKGIRWKVRVPGHGHASPILFDDRIFISTADEAKQNQSLIAYHCDTGAQLWNTVLYRGRFMFKHQKNSHASATPVCDGARVYVPTVADGALWLTAVNIDGRSVWQTRLGPFVSEWGYASSPALYKDLLIVVGDNKGTPGVPESSYLVAVKRDSGKVVWRVPRPLIPSYGTPVVARLAGRDQLLLSGAERIVAYDPANGKEFWSCRWGAFRSANSMVCGPDCVYASTTWPDNQIVCIRADGEGDVTDSHLVWKHARSVTDIPSALFYDGRLYLTADRGMAVCMDGTTGKTIWQNRLGGPISSSPVLAGQTIFSTDELGATHLFKAGTQFESLAINNLNDAVFASPALCGDRIILRSKDFLYCLDGITPGAPVTVNIQPAPPLPPLVRPGTSTSAPKVAIANGPPARRTDQDDVPMWMWFAIGGLGFLTLLALFVLVIVILLPSAAAKETAPAPASGKKSAMSTVLPVLRFICTACGKPLKIKEQLAGKKVKCPHCSNVVLVPASKNRITK